MPTKTLLVKRSGSPTKFRVIRMDVADPAPAPAPLVVLDPNLGIAEASGDQRIDDPAWIMVDGLVDQAEGVTRTWALPSGESGWAGGDPRYFWTAGAATTAPLSAAGATLAGRTAWTISLRCHLDPGNGACAWYSEDGDNSSYLDLGFDDDLHPTFRVTEADGTGGVTLACPDTLFGVAGVASMATAAVDGGDRTRVELALDPHPTLTDGAFRFSPNDRVMLDASGPWTVVEADTDLVVVVVDGSAPGSTPAAVARTGYVEWVDGEPGEFERPDLVYPPEDPRHDGPRRIERERHELLTVRRDGDTIRWYVRGHLVGSATSAGLPTGPSSGVTSNLFRSPTSRAGAGAPTKIYISRIEAYDAALDDAARLEVERRLSIGVNRTWMYGPAFFHVDLTGLAGVRPRDMPHCRCYVEFREAASGNLAHPGTPATGLEWASSYSTPTGWFVTQVLGDGEETSDVDYTVSVTVLNPAHDEDGTIQADALIQDGVIATLTVRPWPGDGATYYCSGSAAPGGSGTIGSPFDDINDALSVAGPLDRVLCERGTTFGGPRSLWRYTGMGPLLLGSYGDPGDPPPVVTSTVQHDLLQWDQAGVRVSGIRLEGAVAGGLWLLKPGAGGLVHGCQLHADAAQVGGINFFHPIGLGVDDCAFTTGVGVEAHYGILGDGATACGFTRLGFDWVPVWNVALSQGSHPFRYASSDRVQLAYCNVGAANGAAAFTPRQKILWLNVHDCMSIPVFVSYSGAEQQGWCAANHGFRVHRCDMPIQVGNCYGADVSLNYVRTGIMLSTRSNTARGVIGRCRAHSNRVSSSSGIAEQESTGGAASYHWQVAPTAGDRRNLIDPTGQFGGGVTFEGPPVTILKASGSRLVVALPEIVEAAEGRFELRYEVTPSGGSASEVAGAGGAYFGIPLAPGIYSIGTKITDEPGSNTVFGPTSPATVTS